MTIQRNSTVRIVSGEHSGMTGRVIRRPMGQQGITSVIREDGRTFDVKAVELQVVETAGAKGQ